MVRIPAVSTASISAFTKITQATSRQTMRVLNQAFTPRGDNPIELAIIPIGLAVPFAIAALFKLGKMQREGQSEVQKTKLLYALGEAGLANLLVQGTKGVYPILTAGLSAYEMGRAESPTDKIKALIKTWVVMPVGFLGTHLGLFINDALRNRDAQIMKDTLKPLLDSIPESLASLKGVLQELLKASEHVTDITGQKFLESVTNEKLPPLLTQMKVGANAMYAAQENVLNAVSSLTPEALSKLDDVAIKKLGELGTKIQANQVYNLVRMMNPIFGYILATALIGIPLAKMLTDKFIPDSGTTTSPTPELTSFSPLWLDKAMGPMAYPQSAIPFHPPILEADGPALIRGMQH